MSRAVLEAQGSVMTNKYAEGYPGRRYYGGCQFVDIAEDLAIERAKELFGCGFANVQPNSGSQANQAVFLALMQPGDTFMGLDLAAGGHLTHGSPVNMSGRWFKPVPYTVDRETSLVDMDEVERLAKGDAAPSSSSLAARPIRASGISPGSGRSPTRSAPIFMVDMAHFAGLVAGGAHPSPFPHAHVVTSTTHKTLRGPRGGLILTDDEAIAKKVNSAIFPGLQGGPLMHVIAAKAVAFGEALTPEFKAYARQVVDNAKVLADSVVRRRLRDRVGRHRQPPHAGRPAAQEADRQGGRGGARPRPHHVQQERHSFRPGEAGRHIGHPARHTGGAPRAASAWRSSSEVGSLIVETLDRPGSERRGRQRRGRGRACDEGRGPDPSLSHLLIRGETCARGRRPTGAG